MTQFVEMIYMICITQASRHCSQLDNNDTYCDYKLLRNVTQQALKHNPDEKDKPY